MTKDIRHGSFMRPRELLLAHGDDESGLGLVCAGVRHAGSDVDGSNDPARAHAPFAMLTALSMRIGAPSSVHPSSASRPRLMSEESRSGRASSTRPAHLFSFCNQARRTCGTTVRAASPITRRTRAFSTTGKQQAAFSHSISWMPPLLALRDEWLSMDAAEGIAGPSCVAVRRSPGPVFVRAAAASSTSGWRATQSATSASQSPRCEYLRRTMPALSSSPEWIGRRLPDSVMAPTHTSRSHEGHREGTWALAADRGCPKPSGFRACSVHLRQARPGLMVAALQAFRAVQLEAGPCVGLAFARLPRRQDLTDLLPLGGSQW